MSKITDIEIMSIIRSRRVNGIFSTVELTYWLCELNGSNYNNCRQRTTSFLKTFPVEFVGGKFYRLMVVIESNDQVKNEPKKRIKSVPLDMDDFCRQVLSYLNEKTGKNFKGKESDLLKIKARMSPPENFTVEDFRCVIDKKFTEWNGTDMEQYLRPETLFGNKFEGYLNQTGSSKKVGKAEEMASYDFNKYLGGKK